MEKHQQSFLQCLSKKNPNNYKGRGAAFVYLEAPFFLIFGQRGRIRIFYPNFDRSKRYFYQSVTQKMVTPSFNIINFRCPVVTCKKIFTKKVTILQEIRIRLVKKGNIGIVTESFENISLKQDDFIFWFPYNFSQIYV